MSMANCCSWWSTSVSEYTWPRWKTKLLILICISNPLPHNLNGLSQTSPEIANLQRSHAAVLMEVVELGEQDAVHGPVLRNISNGVELRTVSAPAQHVNDLHDPDTAGRKMKGVQ